jgi:carboxyl-terminal processing protease
VPADCAHNSPQAVPATSQPSPTPSANRPISTPVQLHVIDQLVEVVNRLYLYPDFNGADWPGIALSYRHQIEAGVDTETFYADMQKLVTALGDEHSSFESPAQVAQTNAALAGTPDYVGIGVVAVPLLDTGHETILSVRPDSTAAHNGLKPHDTILAVDGKPVIDKGVAHNELIRGPRCSSAVFTMQTPGKASRKITMIRDLVTTGLSVDARLVPTRDGSRIGYIFLPTFLDETIQGKVKQALEDFGTLDGLVLDDRMNPGGSSIALDPTLSYFTSGTLGHFLGRNSDRPYRLSAHPVGDSERVPLVVMVGKYTVSYGEIFAGILKDVGRGRLVGETTLGNVERLRSATFEDGSLVWLAEERFDPAVSHADWEKTGIVPDVNAVASWDMFTFETDPGLAASLKLLGHQ